MENDFMVDKENRTISTNLAKQTSEHNLYKLTKSFEQKVKPSDCSTDVIKQYQIPSKPTIPISPKLRSLSRTRPVQVLSFLEQELVEIEDSRKLERENIFAARKLYELNRVRAASGPLTQPVHTSKASTIPVTPIRNLTQRLGPKQTYRNDGDESDHGTKHAPEETGPRKPTVPEPFIF
ncbi:unnamed protein product [Sphagnum balticum]